MAWDVSVLQIEPDVVTVCKPASIPGQDQGSRVLYCLILARCTSLPGHMQCPIVLGLLHLFLNLGNPPANSLPPLCIVTFQAGAHSCQNLFTRLCIRIRFKIVKRVGQWMKLIVSCWLLTTNVLPCVARALQVSISSSTTLFTELQKMEAAPDPSMSSRREGFRWSNASSNDMGFDGQSIDMTEQLYLENVRLPYNPTDDQKCGLCGRLLVQKSPWSSYRIVRSGDMPIAGVLPCSLVFLAEWLEQKTPKTQVHDPGPLCQKIANGAEASSPVLEPLQMALRAAHEPRGRH